MILNFNPANYLIVIHVRTGMILLLLFLQQTCLLALQDTFTLHYQFADERQSGEQPALQSLFTSPMACSEYLKNLPSALQKKGYLAASVDTVIWEEKKATAHLFVGHLYQWNRLRIPSADDELLKAAGYQEEEDLKRLTDPVQINTFRERIVRTLEESGYPFASVRFDSVHVTEGKLDACLIIDRGPLYRIDSIRIYGGATIKISFLKRYLELPEGAIYQRSKLQQISKKLAKLPYLQETEPWNLNLLGTGSVLDLYLKNKQSSQMNGILGFLPSANLPGGRKMVVTGDVNVQLKNSFGLGESFLFLFQQIQIQSPRLQLSYQQPYIGGSAFGLDLGFDGFRKDSSFLNIRLQAGTEYALRGNTRGKIFVQQFITTLDVIDTSQIRFTRRLPAQLDQRTTSLGIDLNWDQTDGSLNPRTGLFMQLNGMVGIRRIKPNAAITSIKNVADPLFNYGSLYDSLKLRDYSVRLQGSLAYFLPTGRQTVLKGSIQAGLVESRTIFRNELFQIGGFQLLRGFNDQSIFASLYGVGTVEYRLLTGRTSYLYSFVDGGLIQNKNENRRVQRFLGTGIGTVFNTKAGLFNLTMAAGAGAGNPLNLREMKIHFGYINQF